MSRSNGHLALTAIFGSLISVLVAGLASAATDRLFLRIVGGLGDEPLSAVFLILPVGVTIVIGVVHRYGTSLIVGAPPWSRRRRRSASPGWSSSAGSPSSAACRDNACFD
jgi:hypothetical protein